MAFMRRFQVWLIGGPVIFMRDVCFKTFLTLLSERSGRHKRPFAFWRVAICKISRFLIYAGQGSPRTFERLSMKV